MILHNFCIRCSLFKNFVGMKYSNFQATLKPNGKQKRVELLNMRGSLQKDDGLVELGLFTSRIVSWNVNFDGLAVSASSTVLRYGNGVIAMRVDHD